MKWIQICFALMRLLVTDVEIATSQMFKAGALRGATGEYAICLGAGKAGLIVGSIAIPWAMP